jgi:uncharacterized protein YueI
LSNNLNKDAVRNFANKTELERTISVGLQGPPELKLEEKMHYLGEFRERILKSLTKGQVMKSDLYKEIIEALQDKRATKMLLHGDLAYKFRGKYQSAATEIGKSYTIVHDPDLKGDLGLVIASDQAVDIEDIYIDD